MENPDMRKLLAASFFALFAFSGAAHGQGAGPGMPVSGAVINRSTVNSSVVIATGNTFQQVLASNFGTSTQRQALTIQNNNATDSCWIVLGGTLGAAAKGSAILLISGAAYTRYWPFVPSDVIFATCATSSDTLYVDTQ